MADVQHNLLSGDQLHNPFKFGNDALKSGSPTVGMWYFATDTGSLYRCKTVGTWELQSKYIGTKEVDETGIADGYRLTYDSTSGKLIYEVGSDAVGSYNFISINQTLHGFNVGDVLRFDSGTSEYVKAQANTFTGVFVTGIVIEATDADNFKMLLTGYISGLSGLTPGQIYYLSASTAGALTSTEPSTPGQYSKPLLIAISATEGFFNNWRSVAIGSSANSYQLAFTNADLIGGVLSITHGLSNKYCNVTVYDSDDHIALPDDVHPLGVNTMDIDLTSFGTLIGTWNLIVSK